MADERWEPTPSQSALEFGEQYAEVLERWAELFQAAAGLVRANVALGTTASNTAGEFDEWLRGTATGPLAWFSPEAMQGFMRTMAGAATGQPGEPRGPQSGGPGPGLGRMK